MAETLFFLIVLGSFYEAQAQALPQAKLTVNSSTIKETDSVTISCQSPAHVSEHKCHFYVNRGTQRPFSCVKTFTGTELLRMAKQSSSSVVEVRCYYIVKNGAVDSPSPHSGISYITISLKPHLSMNYFKGEFATFSCLLPGSVKDDTTCNVYFGESSHPVKTTTIEKEKSSRTNQWFCQIEIPEDELLKHLRLDQQKQFSCDYSLESDGKHLSPRSDPYSVTVSSSVTSVMSTNKTEDRESKGKYIEMWKLILAAAAGGLTVVFILVLSACLRAKGRTGVKNDQSAWMKTIDSSEMLPPKEDRVYCLITSLPDTDGPTGCRKSANEKQQTDQDVYHMYSTIPDLPP
ncbi:uncharacterized protein V3H82_006845 [Fundulus diaphanus]